jgi:KAP family P-loop domain
MRRRWAFWVQFEEDFKHVVSSVTDNGNRPLVIFIDDLDRAAPPKPVEVIEAINMLVDSKYCVFVLGMDSQTVAKSIEAKYKDLKDSMADADTDEPSLGRRFLEKIVQIPFAIPRANKDAFTAFIDRNLGVEEQEEDLSEARITAAKVVQEEQTQGKSDEEVIETLQSRTDIPTQVRQEAVQEIRAKSFGNSEEVRQAISVALPYLGYNPRKVKRFINLFQLQALIANRRGWLDNGTIELDRLAKWMLVSMGWPTVTEAIIADHSLQNRLLEAHRLARDMLPQAKDESKRSELTRTMLEPLLEDSAVKRLYRTKELMNLLDEASGSEAEILPYLDLTEITTSRS